MPVGVAGEVIALTVAADNTRTPPSCPPLINIRTNRCRSRAVLKRPAWPAMPPMRRAVGSCTTPRSGAASGRLHGQASWSAQRSVGAMRGNSVFGGLNPVSVIPSGSNTVLFK